MPRTIPRIRTFIKRHDVKYPMLLAGTTNPSPTTKTINEALPEIVNFGAYPTAIYLGRDGRVRSVHAGFASPATSNQMEMRAVQEGLAAIAWLEEPVEVVSDSAYVVNCFIQKWHEGWRQRVREDGSWRSSIGKRIANQAQWEEFLTLVDQMEEEKMERTRATKRLSRMHSEELLAAKTKTRALATIAKMKRGQPTTPDERREAMRSYEDLDT